MDIESEIITLLEKCKSKTSWSKGLQDLFEKLQNQGISYDEFIDRTIIVLLVQDFSLEEILKKIPLSKSELSKRILEIREHGMGVLPDETKTTLKIINYIVKGNSAEEIAPKLNMPLEQVSQKIEQIISSLPYSRIQSQYQKDNSPSQKPSLELIRILDLYQQIQKRLEANETHESISTDLNVSRQRVTQLVAEIEDFRRLLSISSEHDEHKINGEIIASISNGISPNQIAQKLGVSINKVLYKISLFKKYGIELYDMSGQTDAVDTRILHELSQCKTQSEIVDRLKVPQDAVSFMVYMAEKQGISIIQPKTNEKTENDEIDNLILSKLENGDSIATIAHDIHLATKTVKMRINNMMARKIKTPSIKFDEDILAKLFAGEKQQQIADDLEVSPYTIEYRVSKLRQRLEKYLASQKNTPNVTIKIGEKTVPVSLILRITQTLNNRDIITNYNSELLTSDSGTNSEPDPEPDL